MRLCLLIRRKKFHLSLIDKLIGEKFGQEGKIGSSSRKGFNGVEEITKRLQVHYKKDLCRALSSGRSDSLLEAILTTKCNK